MNKILLVPGLHNSGPDHWQSRWHQQFPQWQRMMGLPWDKPDLTVWSAKLASKLRSRRSRVHLVAHSFGALTAIAAARLQPDKVSSIFIVAPADPARFGIPDEVLTGSIKVSAQLIASRNDPWMSFERAEFWSRQWQVPLFDAGRWAISMPSPAMGVAPGPRFARHPIPPCRNGGGACSCRVGQAGRTQF